MVMNASGSWNPRALARIRPIDALFDFGDPVRESPFDGRFDRFPIAADRVGQLDERRELRP
jgi:hypothetical protein